MTPTQFKEQLKRTARRLSLTAADLGIWFDRPSGTVDFWLRSPVKPRRGAVFNELVRRLQLLEQSVTVFPVPYEVRAHARRAYVTRARNNALTGGVSAGDPAVIGTVLLGKDQTGEADATKFLQPDRTFTTSYIGEQDE